MCTRVRVGVAHFRITVGTRQCHLSSLQGSSLEHASMQEQQPRSLEENPGTL